MSYWQGKVAIVTGGSSGFGRVLVDALARRGCRVVIVSRQAKNVQAVAEKVRESGGVCLPIAADVTRQDDVDRVLSTTLGEYGQLDLLINAAGRSMRGAAAETTVDEYRDLLEINFLAAVRCTNTALPELAKTQGHVVLIGSLASKVAARWLGAYPASKFPLVAYAQQLRLELAPGGAHVLLVCPGPIGRENSIGCKNSTGTARYADQAESLPDAATKPGGGAKIRTLDPKRLAESVLSACCNRKSELIVPAKSRILFVLSQISPGLGDWLLKKMT